MESQIVQSSQRETIREMESQIVQSSQRETISKMMPYMAMVALQIGFAGMSIISVISLRKGISNYVLVVYHHAAAFLAIAPFALILERPVIDQNLYYVGMKYTSATFVSSIVNILPAITFVLAIILRIEKVKIKELSSQAKVYGTLVTVGGAIFMTLYKGPILNMVWSKGHAHHASSGSSGGGDHKWIMGVLFIFGDCFGWSCFFILQSVTLRSYPAELSLAASVCFMGMVQGGAVALVMERKPGAWSIGWDTRILAPIYSGIVCSAIAYYVQGIVMKKRGPVFVTAFSPLCMIIVTILGSIILGDEISIGRVIGATIIVIGLYCFVWGKSKDPLMEEILA